MAPLHACIESYFNGSSIVAIDFLSSQVTMIRGSITNSAIGLRIWRTTGGAINPDASMHFLGTVWSGNTISVDIIGNQSINAIGFYGVWIEDTDLILRTSQAQSGVTIGSILFEHSICASHVDMMDLRNNGVTYVEVNGGTFYPILDEGNGTIYADGLQQIRLLNVAGWDRINFTGDQHGLESSTLLLINDASGYQPAGWQGSSWASGWQDIDWAFDGKDVINATVFYRWNPNSDNAGVSLLFGGTRFGEFETVGGAGDRADQVDISAFVRANMTLRGDLGIQAHGNSTTAPTIYLVQIIVEW